MRLITRADFDGLACGSILMELGIVDSWKFVHPKDLQDGRIEVNSNDLLANVPYAPGCGMWFDHHASELERSNPDMTVEGVRSPAPSAARIVFEYYGGAGRLPHLEEMVNAVDKVDTAKLTVEDIINPTGWILLGFIMDPRTGLGRHRHFSIGNWELMEELMDACRDYRIDELLMLPNVAERIEYYNKQNTEFRKMIIEHSTTKENVIITDLRGVNPIYSGNRFLLYSIFPEQNISIWVADGVFESTMIAVGHSIINKTSNVNVSKYMAKYGGGGHIQAGTCQVSHDAADTIIEALITDFNGEG